MDSCYFCMSEGQWSEGEKTERQEEGELKRFKYRNLVETIRHESRPR
jgi:hypothetical protein